MPYTPPWTSINPLDFINAANSGAQTGLRARQIGDEETNAANSALRARDALAMAQQQFQQNLQTRAASTAAAQALRQKQSDALAQYRQDQIIDQQQRIKDAEATKSAAATLQGLVSDDTQGALQLINDGTDPITAKQKKPHADDRVMNPLISNYLKQKQADNKKSGMTYANAIQILNNKQNFDEETVKQATETLKGMNSGAPPITIDGASAASVLNGTPQAASPFAVQPSAGAPDAMAAFAGGSTTPTFTKGQKVKQGGKIYQFDGTDWNEVNE